MSYEHQPPPKKFDGATGDRDALQEVILKSLEIEKKKPADPYQIRRAAPQRLQEQVPAQTIQQVQAVITPQAASGDFVYGDGNQARQGDLIECAGELAEVTRVASNGIVVEIPVKGCSVLTGDTLLQYKKVGQRGAK